MKGYRLWASTSLGVPAVTAAVSRMCCRTGVTTPSAYWNWECAGASHFRSSLYELQAVCGDEVAEGKPHPGIFIAAARLLGVPAGQVSALSHLIMLWTGYALKEFKTRVNLI